MSEMLELPLADVDSHMREVSLCCASRGWFGQPAFVVVRTAERVVSPSAGTGMRRRLGEELSCHGVFRGETDSSHSWERSMVRARDECC